MSTRDWKTTTVGLLLALATAVSMAPEVFSQAVVERAKAAVVLLTALLGWFARDSHAERSQQPADGENAK